MTRICLLLLILPMIACAAATGPGLRADHPPHPEPAAEVAWASTSITGAGGLPLFVQRWRPRARPPRGVVVIHHGLADHSDRYAGFARTLVRAGYSVWALDMRGHARSAGPRVLAEQVDDYLDDLDALLAEVRTVEPNPPVYLFGHSLGGLITSLYAIERGDGIAGLIVSAPGIAFDEPALQAALIRTVAAIAPGAPLLETPHENFSSSPQVVADMNRDPLIYQGNGPVQTAAAAVAGVHRVWTQVDDLDVPVLALHGTADKQTAPSGSRDLVARAGTVDATLRLYDGLAHDLLHEPGGGAERVATDVVRWLDAHTAGGPALESSLLPPRLKGDRGPAAISIELDVRADTAFDDESAARSAISAGARVRLSRGSSTPLALGWRGGLDLRGGHDGAATFTADAYLLGVAARLGGAGELALTGGIGVGRSEDDIAPRVPVEVSLELPAGPLRLLTRAYVRSDFDDDADEVAGLADEVGAAVGLRLGRDRRYWGNAVAGTGPYFAVTWRRLGGNDIIGAALGVDLWGGN